MDVKIRWYDLMRDAAIVMGLSTLAGVVVVVVYGIRQSGSQDAIALTGTLNKVALLLGFLLVGSLGRKPKPNRLHHLVHTAIGVWFLGLANILLMPNVTFRAWFMSAGVLAFFMIIGGGLSFFFAPPPETENQTTPDKPDQTSPNDEDHLSP